MPTPPPHKPDSASTQNGDLDLSESDLAAMGASWAPGTWRAELETQLTRVTHPASLPAPTLAAALTPASETRAPETPASETRAPETRAPETRALDVSPRTDAAPEPEPSAPELDPAPAADATSAPGASEPTVELPVQEPISTPVKEDAPALTPEVATPAYFVGGSELAAAPAPAAVTAFSVVAPPPRPASSAAQREGGSAIASTTDVPRTQRKPVERPSAPNRSVDDSYSVESTAPAWERVARAALEQSEAEPNVIVDPSLNAPLTAAIVRSIAARPRTEEDLAFLRRELAGLSDEDSLLPFFMPPPPPATPTGRFEHPRVEGAPVPPPPWFERFFDADYLAFEPQASEKRTERETDFIVASFGLTEGARILDLACGTGRHAIELARRGYQVVGLDLSKPLLERAVSESRARKLSVDFVHGDMRSLAFRRLFDAVLLWGSSFGYFRDAENALVLRKVAQAMRPGGRLLLELKNRDFVQRDVPRSRWRRETGGLVFDEIDFEWRTSRFKLRRSIMRVDGKERIDSLEFRGYTLAELLALLATEGFAPLEISGRVASRGTFFGAESPSILLLAEVR